MSLRLRIDARKLQTAAKRMQGVKHRSKEEQHDLAKQIASAVKEVAEKRVRVLKRAPNGRPWKRWSPAYAKTRGAQHSLLVDSGLLLRSFDTYASPGGHIAQVSNSAPYAGYVQALRPFLGLGKEEDDVTAGVAAYWLSRLAR